MTFPQVWSNTHVPAMAIGRLAESTLSKLLLGRTVFFRTGPWVLLEEDDSRLVGLTAPGEADLLGAAGHAMESTTAGPVDTVAAVVADGPHHDQAPSVADSTVGAEPPTVAAETMFGAAPRPTHPEPTDGPAHTIVLTGVFAQPARVPHSRRPGPRHRDTGRAHHR